MENTESEHNEPQLQEAITTYLLAKDEEAKSIRKQYQILRKSLLHKLNKTNSKLLKQAFIMATDSHRNMRRRSGEPYIFHPIAVALICTTEIGLGVRSAACALLHDTVEDTEITINDIQREFGAEIAKIIEGLTKISTVNLIHTTSSIQIENFKKILLTLTDDPRVILIKLADRLHNMRTLGSMKPDKQTKIASETEWVYAPLAHRMGLYSIKTELEDLAMKYLDPKPYKEIANKLLDTKRERTRYVNEFIRPIKEKLIAHNLDFEIYGRPKSIHSIWHKIQTKNIAFENIYDLFAIRVILKSAPNKEKEDCWKVYSVITDLYQPLPNRLRDWLSTPKSNGYEALHTTVRGPKSRWVEVQIRTQRMNEIAEKGLAAHFKYKENKTGDDRFDTWFTQIRDLIASQKEDTTDFLNEFKNSILVEDIYVYTPKGEVKVLLKGSTALDFAFAIHTDVGSKCIGAKVHHKLVPIGYKLQSGDMVEIILGSKQKPREDWLNIVTTRRAKSKIQDALREEKRKIGEEGKYILQRKLENIGAHYTQGNIDSLMLFYKQPSQLEFLYLIATKIIDLKDLKELTVIGGKVELQKPAVVLKLNTETGIVKKEIIPFQIFGADSNEVMFTLAKCCNPIHGDSVFGFVRTGQGLIIHRKNCKNAAELFAKHSDRIVGIQWGANQPQLFLTGLEIFAADHTGLMQKIVTIISSDFHLNIAEVIVTTTDNIFRCNVKVAIHHAEELNDLICQLQSIEGVQSVHRFNTEESSTEL